MRKPTLTLLLAATFFALTAVSAMVYARESDGSSGSMMRHGMMGGGHMMGGQMSRMMAHCGDMMQGKDRGSGRPNEQWRDR
jgi:Spy/CpxP family protein refolding chaperone